MFLLCFYAGGRKTWLTDSCTKFEGGTFCCAFVDCSILTCSQNEEEAGTDGDANNEGGVLQMIFTLLIMLLL